jgi:MoxR-like ATPase
MSQLTPLVLPPFDVYAGDGGNHADLAAHLPDQPPLAREEGRYLAAPELALAVNISIAVGQPLLVTGEPGCGKTRLAWSVAAELGLGQPLTFFTRSSSRWQDLFYQYDAVLRFNDIQSAPERARDAKRYVYFGPLGQAIKERARRVVLIDEVDKAPRDFPNDVLNELDKMEFEVPELETGEGKVRYSSTVRPIVIITSNSERQLPLPFLRRCVFHHITFPSRERLEEIVHQRLGPLQLERAVISAAVERFEDVRRIPGLVKAPATGELLAWIHVLGARRVNAAEIRRIALRELPFLQALLKDHGDWELLART